MLAMDAESDLSFAVIWMVPPDGCSRKWWVGPGLIEAHRMMAAFHHLPIRLWLRVEEPDVLRWELRLRKPRS